MSAPYCAIKLSHNIAYQNLSVYRHTANIVYTCITKASSPALIATCHKVMYLALEICPRLLIVSIPTALMLWRGMKVEDISPALIGVFTWILFGMLSVFYPWDALTNLSESVRHNNKLVPVISDSNIIDRMSWCLASNQSILLHGSPGCGKTTAVRALAAHLASPKCPPALKNKEIVCLSLENILADHQEFLKNVITIVNVVQLNPHAILCIDEIHRLTQPVHGIKIADTLKLYFGADSIEGTKPLIQVIGMTTTDEKKKMSFQDLAFMRRFTPLQMNENNAELHHAILKNKFSQYTISKETLNKVIETAENYRPDIALPASGIDILKLVIICKEQSKIPFDAIVSEDIEKAISDGFITK